jgi:hypothetical protein
MESLLTPHQKRHCFGHSLNDVLVRDMQDALKAAGRTGDECVVGGDDLLPALIFLLVRARVPRLYSQAKLMFDFLPDREAAGQIGFNMVMLQVRVDAWTLGCMHACLQGQVSFN